MRSGILVAWAARFPADVGRGAGLLWWLAAPDLKKLLRLTSVQPTMQDLDLEGLVPLVPWMEVVLVVGSAVREKSFGWSRLRRRRRPSGTVFLIGGDVEVLPSLHPTPAVPGVKTLTLLGSDDATGAVFSLEALLLGPLGVSGCCRRAVWRWRCCLSTLAFFHQRPCPQLRLCVGEPRRVAWLRKVSSCCECQGFVPALVLGLVPAVCSAQGERFHCRRFGVLSSQDEGVGTLSGNGGVLTDDR
jgi:hypothetical protein